jgi:hypothetical protein
MEMNGRAGPARREVQPFEREEGSCKSVTQAMKVGRMLAVGKGVERLAYGPASPEKGREVRRKTG